MCVSSRQWYLDLNEDGPLKLLSRCRALLSIEGHAHQHSTIKEKTNKWTKSRQSECGNILIAIVPQWKCSSIEAAPKTFIFHISSRICHCMSLYSEYMGLWCWMYGCDVVRMLIAEWDRIWNRRRRADAFKVNQMPLIKYIRHIHPAASHCWSDRSFALFLALKWTFAASQSLSFSFSGERLALTNIHFFLINDGNLQNEFVRFANRECRQQA